MPVPSPAPEGPGQDTPDAVAVAAPSAASGMMLSFVHICPLSYDATRRNYQRCPCMTITGGGLRDKFQPPSFGLPLSHEGTCFTSMAFFRQNLADSIVLTRTGNNSVRQLFSIRVGPEVQLAILQSFLVDRPRHHHIVAAGERWRS